MALVRGVTQNKGKARKSFTIPAGSGQYAPEILYLNSKKDAREALDVIDSLTAVIESLPATASFELDLLSVDGDPTPDGPWASVAAARGSNDRQVATGAFDYWIGNSQYAKAAVTAGTALPAGTIPVNQWGGFSIYIDTAGVITILAAANNFTTGYASSGAADTAAQAIATPANSIRIARFVVQTKVGFTFVCGTDGLNGGASGNVANATTYTNEAAVTGNWILNVAPAWNAVGLKAKVELGGWEGARIRGKSGGTPGTGVLHATWK